MRFVSKLFSPYGHARVWAGTGLGTAVCIAAAFSIDSYSWRHGTWELSATYLSNLVIPLVVAPPFFFYLLSKLRQLAIAHRELMLVASTDGLTNCLNRHAFMMLLDRYLDRAFRKEEETKGALLVIDIDHFKRINDTFGHACGDEALKAVAGVIKGAVRETDFVGRIGGEEFGVLVVGATFDKTATVAERIRREVYDLQLQLGGSHKRVSVSIGGAAIGNDSDANALYRAADERLYLAKRSGRNRVVLDGTSAQTLRLVAGAES